MSAQSKKQRHQLVLSGEHAALGECSQKSSSKFGEDPALGLIRGLNFPSPERQAEIQSYCLQFIPSESL